MNNNNNITSPTTLPSFKPTGKQLLDDDDDIYQFYLYLQSQNISCLDYAEALRESFQQVCKKKNVKYNELDVLDEPEIRIQKEGDRLQHKDLRVEDITQQEEEFEDHLPEDEEEGEDKLMFEEDDN